MQFYTIKKVPLALESIHEKFLMRPLRHIICYIQLLYFLNYRNILLDHDKPMQKLICRFLFQNVPRSLVRTQFLFL